MNNLWLMQQLPISCKKMRNRNKIAHNNMVIQEKPIE